MRSAVPLSDISTHDLDHSDLQSSRFSPWSTGPSSPPFLDPLPPSEHPPDSSSLSTPSTEFEFDSLFSLQIKDDCPVSPKLITSPTVTTDFWAATAAAAAAPNTAAATDNSLSPQKIPPPPSHPITPSQHPSDPPSPSVRQLLAEEMRGELHDDLHPNFYTAPSTPLRTPPTRKSNLSQRPLSQDDPTFMSLGATPDAERRKSYSAAQRDKLAYDHVLPQPQYKNQVLRSSKSDANSHFNGVSTSSSAREKNEDLERSVVKKQGSKISMKWAFKDLLRKTVPSSNAEAHYITKIMGASSSKRYLPSSRSHPNLTSPSSSPMHSISYTSTPQASQPSTPRRSSKHGSSSPARSPLRHPSSPARPSTQTLHRTSPMPSPPRSPLAAHAIHYQQNKAQSAELTRKTFLPYRQSLLGCLGGSGAFPPEQQAW